MGGAKLHLGCGRRFLAGWIHVDIGDFEHIDVRTSISDLSDFKNDSASVIYCSHTLEYLDRAEAQHALTEWHRVLSNEGWLYLAVPDIQALLKIYVMTGRLETILGPLFGRIRIEGTEVFAYHKTVYDEQSLGALMRSCGFKQIEAYDPVEFLQQQDKNFDDHSLAYYPHMDRSGVQVSLCLRGQSSKLL